jgi:hypothetical protein
MFRPARRDDADRESIMKNSTWKIAGASLLALAFATACGGEPPPPAPEPTPVAATPAPPPGPDYASFVASTGRTAEDTAKDANRKPADVLAVAKVMPGQTVFEMKPALVITQNCCRSPSARPAK